MACELQSTLTDNAAIDAIVDTLWAEARALRQRRLVWLSGDVGSAVGRVARLIADKPALDVHWHGEQALPGVRVSRGREAFRQLGGECEVLVFNAWSGFDPDALGALAGTLRGGGLLFLLTPAAADWPAWADPEHSRMAVAPFSADDVSGRYLQRLVRQLEADPYSLWIEAGCIRRHPQSPESVSPPAETDLFPCRTRDQQHAVEAVMHVASGHRRRPVVLRSDRGRGKSAAFGIAAARLIADRGLRVVVTAPRRQAVDAVMERAYALLPPALHARLRYLPPDALVHAFCEADLILVDEAAAMSAPLLEQLLRRYPRIAFSTTVHGYEGTGRGFALRFNKVLDRYTNSWKTVTLETPVRWAQGDPLEPLVFRLLMLDAAAAPDEAVVGASVDSASIERVDRDQLVADESTLRELFGLLVLAHYKTRPFDLRQLLDGPNISVYLLRVDGHVAAAALVAQEGGFDAEAAQAITAGVRRPHGHLLPETLAVHLGLEGAPLQHAARVMRIAVHPAVQGRGLGSQLIEAIGAQAATEGIDYLGSSFGASEALLHFWRRADWQPVRISERRGTASGFHSVVVLKPLSRRGSALAARACQRFLRHFPHQLADSLRELDAALVMALMRDAQDSEQMLTADDLADIHRVAHQRRFPESAIGALWTWLCNRLMSPQSLEPLSPEDAGLLIGRILQKHDWTRCARRAGLVGRDQALARMRELLRQLLD